MCVEQNEMSKLGYNRNMLVYVEQNEMSELDYNKNILLLCWTERDVKPGLKQKR